MLARNSDALRNMLADRFLGRGNKKEAAIELLDVLSKSSRVGEIKELLETFVVERSEIVEQEEEEEVKEPELRPTESQVEQE